MLTDDEVAELAALRARAYGAKADLSDDPAGLARLAALEDKARGVVSDQTPVGSLSEGGTTEPERTTGETDPVEQPSASTVAATAPPKAWPRRMVLAIGIPLFVVVCALAGVGGALIRSSNNPAVPSGLTTLGPQEVASWRTVSGLESWDAGSPRLLADIQGSLVWGGTTAGGTMTCVAVDDENHQVASSCGATEELTNAGVGVGVSMTDGYTGELRTFIARPDGAPVVTYSNEGGHLFDCPACSGDPNPHVTITPP